MQTQQNFEIFELDPELLSILNKNKFLHPTPVQLETIPFIRKGTDIFALAKTGSGKTGAFIIPIVQNILEIKKELAKNNQEEDSSLLKTCPTYLVVAPTRELAVQISTVANDFGKELGITSLLVIGGESLEKQKKLAEQGFDILIATPGRLLDLHKQKIINFKSTKGIVFDEVDRLFDMGFKKDIARIISYLPNDRQIFMFSATTNMEVLQTAYRFHSVPHEIKIATDSMLVEKISHSVFHVADGEKMQLLVGILKKNKKIEANDAKDHVLIFCNTQVQTNLISEWLINLGFKSSALFGDLSQAKRNSIITKFRNQEISILVSTDVAARGLDIDGVSLVVNYDLPQDPSNYVHRIGRTGRAGKSGQAINLCSFSDCPFLDQIEEFIKEKIPSEQVDESLLEKNLGIKPKVKRKSELAREKYESKPKTSSKNKTPYLKSKREENRTPYKKEPLTPLKSSSPTQKVHPKMKDTVKAPSKHQNKKFFKIISTNLKQAKDKAMNYFPINTVDHLQFEVLEKGRKAFIFFGPQKITYKFSVKPEYEYYTDIFLHEVIKLMDLDIDYQVEVNKHHVRVKFEGSDEPLLKENRNDLLYAFEHCLKKYLGRFIMLDRSFKISMGNIMTEGRKSSDVNEKKLMALADKMKKRVLENKKSITLKPLSPAERRIIHQHLDQDSEVSTVSVGNGRFKKIRIEAQENS